MSDYSIQVLCLDNLAKRDDKTGLPGGAIQMLRDSVERARVVAVLDKAKRDGYEVTETLSRHGPEGEISSCGGFACVRVAHPDDGSRPALYFHSDTDEPQVAQDAARAAAARALENGEV